MKGFRFFAATACMAFVFSCTKPDEPATGYIELTSEANLSFPAEGGDGRVTFKADGAWTVYLQEGLTAPWLSFSPSSGEYNGSVFFVAKANNTAVSRSAIIAVKCGSGSITVFISQDAGAEDVPPAVVPDGPRRCAELPVYDTTNPDYYYNTLYANTVKSNMRVRNFSFCYDTRRHNPIWVAFPMHSIYTEGSGRSKDADGNDPWSEYDDLARGEQSIIWDIEGDGFMYWSHESAIIGSGSWTKGHLCMSSSRAGAGSELNLQTFYPVNIAPQANSYAGSGIFPDLWSKTENLHWQRGTQICADTLYVVAGCHYASDSNVEYDACNWNTRSAYSKACIMPTHQYKILLRTLKGNTGKAVQDCAADELRTIGFWFDSVPGYGASDDLADYAVSVAEIERRTGITFFPEIPAAAKDGFTLSYWGL